MTTIKEIYKNWREHKELYIKRSSLSAYLLLANNHILPYFGECTEISETSAQEFVLAKLKDGLSQKSVKDIVIVLKMILKHGKKYNMISFDGFDLQYPTDNSKRNIDVLNVADFKKLLDYLKDHFTFRNLGIQIAMSTGMRIGEICALTWQDVDMETGIINISRTIQRIYTINEDNGKRKTEVIVDNAKTQSSHRDIPLSPDLIKIMKPLLKIVRPEYYVLSCSTKPIEPRTYRTYYHDVLSNLDLPRIKFHSLRHTFATRLISAKVDVKTVSSILGHANISTTFNLYVHPDMDQKKAAVKQLFKNM